MTWFVSSRLKLSAEKSAEKTVAIFHQVRSNSHSIAPIFLENIGSFNTLKIIGLLVLPNNFYGFE